MFCIFCFQTSPTILLMYWKISKRDMPYGVLENLSNARKLTLNIESVLMQQFNLILI